MVNDTRFFTKPKQYPAPNNQAFIVNTWNVYIHFRSL